MTGETQGQHWVTSCHQSMRLLAKKSSTEAEDKIC